VDLLTHSLVHRGGAVAAVSRGGLEGSIWLLGP